MKKGANIPRPKIIDVVGDNRKNNLFNIYRNTYYFFIKIC